MDTQDLEKEYKEYEVTFLGLDEAACQEVGGVLSSLGMQVLTTGALRQVELAYPIKKHKTAVLAHYQFQALPEKIKELKDQLSFKANVLRFLIVTPPIKKVVERPRFVPSENQFRNPTNKPVEKIEERINKAAPEILSNELLEQKLEEILQ